MAVKTSKPATPEPKEEPKEDDAADKPTPGFVTYTCPVCLHESEWSGGLKSPVSVTNAVDDVANPPVVVCDACKSAMVPVKE